MSFQTQVNPVQAPGVPGDFASTNPRHAVTGGPGGIVAGVGGVACGGFAWLDQATGQVASSTGAGAPTGFVHNAHNALITLYLGENTLVIPKGFPVGDLFDAGDFWAANNTGLPFSPGQTVYVNNMTGQIQSFAAAGSPPGGGTSTASTIAAGTFSVTGSIAIPTAGQGVGPGTVPAILTVSAVSSGTIVPGAIISGTGIVTGTQIVAQLSGTTGGVGTYSVSLAQNVASTTVSGTYGTLTIGGTVTGTFGVNQLVTGSGIAAGTTITALGTGVGGAGTYIVNLTQTITSQAIGSNSGTASAFFVANGSYGVGAAGEVVKITSKYP